MSKQFKPGRTIVATARPSRIRREPERVEKEAFWRSREWEQRVAIIGVILFALAIAAVWVGVNYVTSDRETPPWEVKVRVGD